MGRDPARPVGTLLRLSLQAFVVPSFPGRGTIISFVHFLECAGRLACIRCALDRLTGGIFVVIRAIGIVLYAMERHNILLFF
jgi:hypothetical protein